MRGTRQLINIYITWTRLTAGLAQQGDEERRGECDQGGLHCHTGVAPELHQDLDIRPNGIITSGC